MPCGCGGSSAKKTAATRPAKAPQQQARPVGGYTAPPPVPYAGPRRPTPAKQ